MSELDNGDMEWASEPMKDEGLPIGVTKGTMPVTDALLTDG